MSKNIFRITFALYILLVVFGSVFPYLNEEKIELNSELVYFFTNKIFIFLIPLSIVGVFLLIPVFYYILGDIFDWYEKTERTEQMSSFLLNIQGAVVALLFASFLIRYLYLFGVLSYVYHLLQNTIFPNFSNVINFALSNFIISSIVSGIIGGFAYDVVKRIWEFLRKG